MKHKLLFPFFLLIYEFSSYLSNDMYLPALSTIRDELSTSTELAQATTTAWFLGLAVLQLFFGPLSDRFGRRPILLLGGGIFLASTALCAVAPNVSILLLGRFFEGIAVGSMLVTGYASIHESFDDAQAIHIIAWMSCITIVAPMAGPVLGAYILLFNSWRGIFWCILFLSAFAIVFLALIMPESNLKLDRQALNLKRLWSGYASLFTNYNFFLGSLVYGLLLTAFLSWIVSSPFLLMDQYKLSPEAYGWAQIPIFAAYGLATRFVTPLGKRFGHDSVIGWGMAIICVAMLSLTAFYVLGFDYKLSLIMPMILYSIGYAFMAPPLNRAILSSSDEQKGSATAAFYFIIMGASALGVLLLNIAFTGTAGIFILSATIIVAAALLLYRLRRYLSLQQQTT